MSGSVSKNMRDCVNGVTRGNGLPTPAWEVNPESAGEKVEVE